MIEVSFAPEATPELAQNLGALMPHLSSQHEGSPIDSRIMDRLTDSESFTLFTADLIADPAFDEDIGRRQLVGAAVLHRVGGLLDNDAVWLESFVADPNVKGQGIGQKIWDTMDEWRKENGLHVMKFTSKTTREKAHLFYERNGCKPIATGKTTLFEHRIDPIAPAKQNPFFE